jgi:hypothetical protein
MSVRPERFVRDRKSARYVFSNWMAWRRGRWRTTMRMFVGDCCGNKLVRPGMLYPMRGLDEPPERVTKSGAGIFGVGAVIMGGDLA